MKTLFHDISLIRSHAPLIHNVTNFVVMQQTANALLALGASPVMAHAEEEMADMVRLSNAVVVNMGTLDAQWVERMRLAMKAADRFNKPCVFDPVGAGATPYRTHVARTFLEEFPFLILRGNASEIMALRSAAPSTKGVDSLFRSEDALVIARELVRDTKRVVVISGESDFIISADCEMQVQNGVSLMTRVVGMGCTATAVVGAFCAINPNPFMACVHAMIVMGVAGEIAFEKAKGPGTFQIEFLDALSHLSYEQLVERARYNTLSCANSI